MRGTITDEGYRDYFAIGEDATNFVEMDERIAWLSAEQGVELEPAKAGVQWATDYTKMLAGGCEIITDEDRLTVKTPMLDSSSGTMDCHIPEKRIIIDLKSGMVRNYKEQLAAYAMEVMNDRFEEEYETYLLFLDSQTVVHYRFTFEEAQGIVDWLEKRSGPQWTEVNSKVGKVFGAIIHSLGEKLEGINRSMVDK